MFPRVSRRRRARFVGAAAGIRPTACGVSDDRPSRLVAHLRERQGLRLRILALLRFSTVRMADLIAVVDGGRIVERGAHGELVALGGVYAELFALQAAAYG